MCQGIGKKGGLAAICQPARIHALIQIGSLVQSGRFHHLGRDRVQDQVRHHGLGRGR